MTETTGREAKTIHRLLEVDPKNGAEADRVIDMIAFIVAASWLDELGVPPNFGFHALTGDRKGVYAMTVTKNWRLTFTLADDVTIANLDLEDYH